MPINYIVVPTSNIDYQAWQIKFLIWSKNKVGQNTKLIILDSQDIEGRPFENYESLGDDIIHISNLPNWAKQWTDEGNSWWGGIPNKYESVNWLCDNVTFIQDSDTLLFVDPDMIFTDKVDIDVNPGEVLGAMWFGEPYKFMYPFAVTFGTLKQVAKDYRTECIKDRRNNTDRWIAEMHGLYNAFAKNNITIKTYPQLAHCTNWWESNKTFSLPKIIHYPNKITDTEGNELWFKQSFTTRQQEYFPARDTKNEIDRVLLENVAQYQSDFIYWAKYKQTSTLKRYKGDKGYILFKPWPGGWNNIRMSVEIAACLAMLKDRTLVIPPTYSMYLLQNENNVADFIDLSSVGIETISFEQYCIDKSISPDWDSIRQAIDSVKFDVDGGKDESTDITINLEKVTPPQDFRKWRRNFNWTEALDNRDTVFFDGNLLGAADQIIHTSKVYDLRQFLAKNLHYNKRLMDIAWNFVQLIGDRSYYSAHIRRNDFQYKDTFLDPNDILRNIQKDVPKGETLYIATDHLDKEYFKPLSDNYRVIFYDDLVNHTDYKDIPNNFIPIIEQLICTRGIKFVGSEYSTLSSYIYRMRGYMDDIHNKEYIVSTYSKRQEDQLTLKQTDKYIGSWFREFKDLWDFKKPSVFLSIASYRDSQVDETIESALRNSANSSNLRIGVSIQDTPEEIERFQSMDFPCNVYVTYTNYTDSIGVVKAREDIVRDHYNEEDYFLMVDSHTRFKENWNEILINQHESLDAPKAVISTYPNEFIYPDPDKDYLELSNNAPLVFKEFFNQEQGDFRFTVGNKIPLEDYSVVENPRICGGFLFATNRWMQEVGMPPGDLISYNGEEDWMTFKSLNEGWRVYCTSEAVVWHNYDDKDREGNTYRQRATPIPDKAAEVVRGVYNSENFGFNKLCSTTEKEKLHVFIWAQGDKEVNPKYDRMKHSANINNVEVKLVGMEHVWEGKTKLRFDILIENIKDLDDDEIVLFMDGYDTLINGSAQEIIRRYKEFNTEILISSEKVFTYQWHKYQDKFDMEKDSNYKYIGAGAYIGRVGALKKMVSEIRELDNWGITELDMGLIGIWVYNNLENERLIQLDKYTKVFWVTSDDIQRIHSEKSLYNSETDNEPLIYHVPGKGESMAQAYSIFYNLILDKNAS